MKASLSTQFDDDQLDIARYEARWMFQTPQAIRMRSRLIQNGCCERISKNAWIVKSKYGIMVALVLGKMPISSLHYRWPRPKANPIIVNTCRQQRVWRIMIECEHRIICAGGNYRLRESIDCALSQDGYDPAPF